MDTEHVPFSVTCWVSWREERAGDSRWMGGWQRRWRGRVCVCRCSSSGCRTCTGMFQKDLWEWNMWHWETDDKESAEEREEQQRKTKKRERRRRESKELQTMALACLGLGCVPVRSKGTVCNTSVFLKTCYYLLAAPVIYCFYNVTLLWMKTGIWLQRHCDDGISFFIFQWITAGSLFVHTTQLLKRFFFFFFFFFFGFK